MQKEVETLAARLILEGAAGEGSVITIESPDGSRLTAQA